MNFILNNLNFKKLESPRCSAVKLDSSSTFFLYLNKNSRSFGLVLTQNGFLKASTIHFSFYSFNKSFQNLDEVITHMVERSVDFYSLKKNKFYSKVSRKGDFYNFFLSNLTNIISNFSDNFFSNLSTLRFESKSSFLNFVSSKNSKFLNFWFFSYFSRYKKYDFLKLYYFNFYLDKNLLFSEYSLKNNYFKIFLNKVILLNERNIFFFVYGKFFFKTNFKKKFNL